MILVQLIDIDTITNHVVSITGCWTYDSNYKQVLPLLKEYLDIVCSPYKYEMGMHAEF